MTPERSGFSPRPPMRRSGVERLFVAWMVTAIALLLMITLATAYLRGVLRRQDRALEALTQRVTDLEQTLGRLHAGTAPLPSSPGRPGAVSSPAPDAGGEPAPASPPPAPTRPTSGGRSAVPAPGEAVLAKRLDAVMARDATHPADVHDRQAAQALLDEVAPLAGRVAWSGPTWTRLAVLACLLDRDELAELFYRHARQAGDPATEYIEVLVRALLARGRHTETLPLAGLLQDPNLATPATNVLLGAVLLANGQPGAADEALAQIRDLSALDTRDRLLLGRLLMKLERWEPLVLVLTDLGEVPTELADERDFLTAVLMARQKRLAEALAVLDYLAAHTSMRPTPIANVWPTPQPSPYEIDVWRGYTLLQAGKLDAAATILNRAIQMDATRGDAYYVLGLLELRLPRRGQARPRLEEAVRRDPTLVAAWEALANHALDEGDTETALGALERALAVNPRRASSHFMLAIVRARLSQRDAAAQALRAAFALDDRYLGEASRAEVLLRLFTVDELEELARSALEPESQPAVPATEPSSAGAVGDGNGTIMVEGRTG
jgi:tetratricopeptide (TPR) repeat protein